MKAKVELDATVDAMYIRLRRVRRASGQRLDDSRYIDLGADGEPVGVELLNVSHGVDTTDLPSRAIIEAALTEHGIRAFA